MSKEVVCDGVITVTVTVTMSDVVTSDRLRGHVQQQAHCAVACMCVSTYTWSVSQEKDDTPMYYRQKEDSLLLTTVTVNI
jgi:hypothetical protein